MNACADHCWVTIDHCYWEFTLYQLYEPNKLDFKAGTEDVPFTLPRLNYSCLWKWQKDIWKQAPKRFAFKILQELYNRVIQFLVAWEDVQLTDRFLESLCLSLLPEFCRSQDFNFVGTQCKVL